MIKNLVEIGRSRFNYTPVTGNLTWRDTGPDAFKTLKGYRIFKKKFVGKIAGHVKSDGYRRVYVQGRSIMAHRLIWAMVNGQEPSDDIDHIDSCRSNNRIENLREATRQQNCLNRNAHVTSKSRIKGVHWHKATGKWAASIGMYGKSIHLGIYSDINDAVSARISAGIDLHGKYRKETLE